MKATNKVSKDVDPDTISKAIILLHHITVVQATFEMSASSLPT